MNLTGQDHTSLEWAVTEIVEDGNSDKSEEYLEYLGKEDQNEILLNTCSAGELDEAGFFNPFQVHLIIEFRNKYGPFMSIYELAAIPGLDRDKLEKLEPYLIFNAENDYPDSFRFSSMHLTNCSSTFPLSDGSLLDDNGQESYGGNSLKIL